ncbi:unnamed protein product [Rhizoctonia solani]|uniref:Uncharacterized protein n=1 Tax=Rhizoctonia solani TaxID=456999 RepID=A0A8H3GF08_9AGAM|nr:unnamed protein product [Rhizoctonia solani]
MSGPPVVFSSVMWAPSDKYGPLVTRRRGSGSVSHAVRGTQPCIASRRNSVDTRGRRSVCTASANNLGQSAQPEVKAPKSVRWLLDEHKFPTDEPQEDKIRMPVPVSVKSSVPKPASQPPACRPFHILELPVYHPEDVRAELNARLLKTLNDVVPLCQTYPIMSPAGVHVQYEVYSISQELANTTEARLVFIADNLPDILRHIRRFTSNLLVFNTPATQGDAARLQAMANAVRQIRKTKI